jgi:hypothetical protein
MQIDITAPDADGRQRVLLAGVQVGYFEPTVNDAGNTVFYGYYSDPKMAAYERDIEAVRKINRICHGMDECRRGDSRMHTADDAARYVVMCYVRVNGTVRRI